MARPVLFAASAACTGVLLLVVLQACVGDDPAPGTSSPTPDGTAPGVDGSTPDGSTPGELAVDPPTIELAPGATVSIKISGGTPGSAATLSVGGEEIPDGGAPAKGVSLAASSVIMSPTGEASVELKASADATQHRFQLTVAGGPAPKVVPGRVVGKPGTLDAFFGDRAGFFDFFTADTGDTTANSVIVQPDGKFIVGGTGKGYQQMLIARFSADGVLDTSFATKGYVLVPGARTPRMALFSDGSIVVAAAAPNNPKLYRFSATGAFVPGWGDAAGLDPGLLYGTLDPAFATGNDTAFVAGRPGDGGVEVWKFLPDAGLDPTFGPGGKKRFTIGFGANIDSDRPFAIVVDPTNGDVWLSGSYYPGSNPSKSWVRRLNATGAMQSVTVDNTTNGAASVMVMQDLKPVLAAYNYGSPNSADDGLSLFRVSGTSVDPNFGAGGETKLSAVSGAGANAIAIDSDKRIYVTNSGVNSLTTFEVYRTTANGITDPTFAENGKFSMPGRAYGLAVTGRYLLVVGVEDGTDQRRARIARLWL